MKKAELKKHVLVPKHEKLSEKEKEEVLRQYGVSTDEFPRILKRDAALQGLNIKQGDLIRISRKSATAGETIFYRVVALS